MSPSTILISCLKSTVAGKLRSYIIITSALSYQAQQSELNRGGASGQNGVVFLKVVGW